MIFGLVVFSTYLLTFFWFSVPLFPLVPCFTWWFSAQRCSRVLLTLLVTQSCLTLWDSMDCNLGSSVHGILQARLLKCVAIPFSKVSFIPRDLTWGSCIEDRFFMVWAIREVQLCSFFWIYSMLPWLYPFHALTCPFFLISKDLFKYLIYSFLFF